MNGKAVCPFLMETRPNLRVIACRGYSLEGPTQKILDAGGNRRVAGTTGQPRILFVNINFCKYEEVEYAARREKRTTGKFNR
jgi:hypothetical protein